MYNIYILVQLRFIYSHLKYCILALTVCICHKPHIAYVHHANVIIMRAELLKCVRCYPQSFASARPLNEVWTGCKIVIAEYCMSKRAHKDLYVRSAKCNKGVVRRDTWVVFHIKLAKTADFAEDLCECERSSPVNCIKEEVADKNDESARTLALPLSA